MRDVRRSNQWRNGRESHQSSFAVFVDGLSDRVIKAKIGAIFGKAGRLRNVYVPVQKKAGCRLRFAFVRYDTDKEA